MARQLDGNRSDHVICVDVGGSGARAALITADGSLASDVVSVEWNGSTEKLGSVARGIKNVIDGVRTRSETVAGLALPGFIDQNGIFLDAPNLPALSGLDPTEVLRDQGLDLELIPVPDISAATVAVARTGSGRSVERLLCVAIGTGINAGLAVAGELVVTAYGCLGDAGHIPVTADGPACPCGGIGCVEATASGAALARAGAEFGFATARAVSDAAMAGSKTGSSLLDRAGRALGRGIAAWSAMTFPEQVVVTGGVSAAGELLLGPARRELERVRPASVSGVVEVGVSPLGSMATLIGAGILAMEADLSRARARQVRRMGIVADLEL